MHEKDEETMFWKSLLQIATTGYYKLQQVLLQIATGSRVQVREPLLIAVIL